MKKAYFYTTFCLIFAVLMGDILYINFGTLLIKGLTSALFVLLGVINFIFAFKLKGDAKILRYMILMLVGLVFAMAGDIVLNIEFIVGAALFALGHIFFFLSYLSVKKFSPRDLIFGVVIFVPSVLVITLVPIFDFGGALMEIVCVVYALIISLMVGKAISNLVQEKSLNNILTVVGSCLFFFSDLMLLFNVFGGLPWASVLCLATYYPAECLLATTIFTASGKVKSEE